MAAAVVAALEATHEAGSSETAAEVSVLVAPSVPSSERMSLLRENTFYLRAPQELLDDLANCTSDYINDGCDALEKAIDQHIVQNPKRKKDIGKVSASCCGDHHTSSYNTLTIARMMWCDSAANC
jgi:hypothetical protein